MRMAFRRRYPTCNGFDNAHGLPQALSWTLMALYPLLMIYGLVGASMSLVRVHSRLKDSVQFFSLNLCTSFTSVTMRISTLVAFS